MAIENYALLNGMVLPTPSVGYGQQQHTRLVDAGRNANGVVIGSVIGRTQSKVNLGWNYLPKTQWEAVAKLLHEHLYVTLEYYDYAVGKRVSRQMYHGDFSAEPFRTDGNGVPLAYINCKVNFIDTGRG